MDTLTDEQLETILVKISERICVVQWYTRADLEEIKARKGKVIAIATEGDKSVSKKADYVFYVPKTIEPLSPLLSVIPLQLFAYYIAVKRGCDVDKPRNLAKSVTVE